jgi:hypothetical protein
MLRISPVFATSKSPTKVTTSLKTYQYRKNLPEGQALVLEKIKSCHTRIRADIEAKGDIWLCRG